MNSNLSQLYARNSPNSDIYLSNQSEVFYYITDYDKYKLQGKNIIIGAVEILLNKLLNISVNRLETVLVTDTANLKKIKIDTFLNALDTHAFTINTIRIIAKKNYLITQIINKNLQLFPENQYDNKSLCIEYYKIMYFLKEEHERYLYPWLKIFIKKYETSLIYKQGRIYYKENLNKKFNQQNNPNQILKFPKDAIIYQNGEEANNIYLLESGAVDIFSGTDRIATINEHGMPLGAIEAFINKERIHTIKTKNEVVIKKIPAKILLTENIENKTVLKKIIQTLAKNFYSNINKLHNINKKVVRQNFDSNLNEKKQNIFSQEGRTIKELKSLKESISELLLKNNSENIKQKYEDLFSK